MEELTRLGLSADRILDAAGELLLADRPSAFSMRKLAERLDVTPMALYRWFSSKEQLLDALTTRAVATSRPDPNPTGTWIERALDYTKGIRGSLLEHLPLLQVEGASRRLTANIFRNADPGLGLMLELGYADQSAVDAYRVLFWSVLNFCLVIDATDAMPTIATSDLVDRVAQLEGDNFTDKLPTLASLLPYFNSVDHDAFFERSMTTVLVGLQATAPKRERPRRARPVHRP